MRYVLPLALIVAGCSPQGFDVRTEYVFLPRWLIVVVIVGVFVIGYVRSWRKRR